MHLSISSFKERVDAIKRERELSKEETQVIERKTPFRNGAQIYLYRMITGLPQKTLANECGLTWDLVRRKETTKGSVKNVHQSLLEAHLRNQNNASVIEHTLSTVDAAEWINWLEKSVGYRPKISLLRCPVCNSTDVSFTTKNTYQALVKTVCNACNSTRYSGNLQRVRTQLWSTSESISVYDISLFKTQPETQKSDLFIGKTKFVLTTQLLKAVRIAAGLSQKDMIAITTVTKDILRRCETGARPIDLNVVNSFQDLFERDPKISSLFVALHKIPPEKVEQALSYSSKQRKEIELLELIKQENRLE